MVVVGLYGPLLTPACLLIHQIHRTPLRHTPAAMSTCPMHRAKSPQVKPSRTFSLLPSGKLLSIFLSVLSGQRTQHLTFLIVTFFCPQNICEPFHKGRACCCHDQLDICVSDFLHFVTLKPLMLHFFSNFSHRSQLHMIEIKPVLIFYCLLSGPFTIVSNFGYIFMMTFFFSFCF